MGKCPFQKNNPAFCPTSQNQLGKGPSFETRFSQNRVIKKKNYGALLWRFKEPIMTF